MRQGIEKVRSMSLLKPSLEQKHQQMNFTVLFNYPS